MRISLAILVFWLTLPLALAQPAKKAGGKTPGQLLPGDCVAYFHYDGYAAHRQAYEQTALGKVMKEGLGDFVDGLLAGVWKLAAGDGEGEDRKKADRERQVVGQFFECLWDQGFEAALEVGPLGKGDGPEDVQLTVVFPGGAKGKNRKTLEKVFGLAMEALEAKPEKSQQQGRSIQSYTRGPSKTAWWTEGEHLVLTVGTQPVARALDVVDGRRSSVADAAWHKELAAPPYETDVRGFVDLETLVKRFGTFGLEAPGVANLKDHLARQVLLWHLGLTDLRQLTFQLGFDGKYQRSTVRLGVAQPEKRGGLMRLVTGPVTYSLDKLPPLPPDTDYVSVRHVDWQGVLDYVQATSKLLALSGLLEGIAPNLLPDLDRALGMDFRKDFLAQLDTTVVTWGAHSEGPFFLGQGFALKVKDAAQVRRGLEAIAKELGEEFTVEKKKFRGHDLYVLNKLPLPLTYAFHDDWLVFGLFPQPVQGVLLRSSGKYRTWQAPPEFAAALAKERRPASSKLQAVSVSDPRPAIEIGLSLLPVFMQSANLGAGIHFLDADRIPNAQSINEWLFPNVMFCYDDGDAFRWENHYSINEADDLLLLPLLSVAFPFLTDLFPIRERPPVAVEAPPAEPIVPPAKRGPKQVNDPKEMVRGKATAMEREGEVVIQLQVPRLVDYKVTRKVRGAYRDEQGNTFDSKGLGRVFMEGATFTTKEKPVVQQVISEVTETRSKQVMMLQIIVADGKKVQVSRKDGKTIEPRELLKLLQRETEVLYVRSGEIDAEELRKIDEQTLIIRTNVQKKQDDAKPPLQCTATAAERNGEVVIQLRVPETVSYNVTRQVRGAYVDEKGKTFADEGPGRRFEEGAVFKPSDKQGAQQVRRVITEAPSRQVMTTKTLIADDNKVHASC
jgi:hypothetical protein